MSTRRVRVAGYCPMGCGQTLQAITPRVGEPAVIHCCASDCPEPSAVHLLLDDGETAHIVDVTRTGFTVNHPLRERVNGELMDCGLTEDLRELGDPPRAPGRYRVTRHEADGYSESYRSPDQLPGWEFEQVPA